MPLSLERPRLSLETGSDAVGAGRIAVVDIGSNSIRLVVYDGLGRAPVPWFNEKIMCGLGRAVERTGRLNPEGVALAIESLTRFGRLIESMGVARVEVLATAAVRDAADGADFITAVRTWAGLPVRVIDGVEEARLSALGVLSGTPEADGLIGDLGGGSLEIVGLERGAVRGAPVTLPVGPLRLIEASGGKIAAAAKQVDQLLDGLDWLGSWRGRDFHPVGGSWRAIAKSHMERTAYPLHVIHHYTVDAAALADFAGDLAKLGRTALEKIPGVSRRRSDTLPFAALVLERVIRRIGPSRIVFSAYGLREGLLYDLLPPERRWEDPLIAACTAVAERLGRFGAAEILAGWTASLFAGEDAAGERLRRAACLLSDLGWSEHPDYRAEHAYLRILRMALSGLDHADRAFLALAIFTRYGGRTDDPITAVARDLLNARQIAKATILGLALRLAQTLTGGVAGRLQRTALRLGDEELVLDLGEDAAALVGDTVRRRLDALAKAVNRIPRILPSAVR